MSRRPFTNMAVCGLQAGLSWRDMRRMKFTHLQLLLWEWEDYNGAECDETRDATADDVMRLMGI